MKQYEVWRVSSCDFRKIWHLKSFSKKADAEKFLFAENREGHTVKLYECNKKELYCFKGWK